MWGSGSHFHFHIVTGYSERDQKVTQARKASLATDVARAGLIVLIALPYIWG